MSEPQQPVQPSAEDFGLSAERMRFFGTQQPLGRPRHRFLPGRVSAAHPLWGLLIINIWLLGVGYLASKTSKPILYFWPILIGCSFALGVLGHALDEITFWLGKVIGSASLARKKREPDYERFQRFREADAKYRNEMAAIYAKQDEERRLQKKLEHNEAARRRQEARRETVWWKSLSGHQFEKELCELFKLRGYDVQLTGLRGADKGIDMIIKTGPKTIIVQCKAHQQYISAGPVRELYGTLIHEREKGRATEAWLVCSSGFYSGAKDFALDKPIRLLTIRQVLEKHEANFL